MPVSCTNCGGAVVVPEGHSRPKIRCGLCGYYTVVPAEAKAPPARETTPAAPSAASRPTPPAENGAKARAKTKSTSTAAEPTPDQHARRAKPNHHAADPRPNFEPDEPAGDYLLAGDDIERDDETTPYAVPGTGTRKCPDCRGELPLDATLCVHCGVDLLARRKKVKREFTPLYRSWEAYLSFDQRMKIFIGMQVLNVLIFVAMLAVLGTGTNLTFMVLQTAMQAFLIGSFDKLVITRTAKGKAEIHRHWRLCFWPLQPQKVDWRVSHGTAVVPLHTVGVFEWMMMVYLLLCGVVPGLLFYWFVIKPERFDVVLCDVHGSTDQMIFRTSSRDIAVEICTMISEATTLAYRKVV